MSPNDLDSLVADLTPVRRLSPTTGILLIASALAAALTATGLAFGFRPDVIALHPAEIVLLRAGVLLIVGLAAAAAVVASARPGVGSRRDGWRWALAAGALFPLASLILILGGDAFPAAIFTSRSAFYCIGVSAFCALLIGAPLLAWLRRGAVTDLGRAGWLTGLTAGALGVCVYSLACPSTTIHYAAVWYTLTVALIAGIGRLVAPPLLRW